MIALFQLIFTAILAAMYGSWFADFTSFMGVFEVIGFYLLINVIYIVLVLILFVISVYVTQRSKKDALWKHQLYMAFAQYIFFSLFRVKPIVKGLENLPKNKRFVVYSNHIEYNDPFYIKQYYNHTPLSYLAKEPLFKIPFVKNVLHSTGCIPIGKLADRSSLESILLTIKAVKSGHPMGIFPEGKRSYSNNPNPFKPGAFKVAEKAKADISLVALYDFSKINRKKFRIRKVKVYMTILPIIKYKDIKDLDTVAISKLAYDMIVAELDWYKKTYES